MVDEVKNEKKDEEEDPVCPGAARLRACSLSTKDTRRVRRCRSTATTSVEPVPSNNIRRKKLYRQLTLMLNGGPLGAKSGSRCRPAVSAIEICSPLILLWATSRNRNYLVEFI
jgi:hypothetical protein